MKKDKTERLLTLREFCATRPFSIHQVRAWISREGRFGLRKYGAVVKIGRNIYIDPPVFATWTKQLKSNGGTL